MEEGTGGWERRWGPQGAGVRGSGWVGLLRGGALMAGEKEVTLPRPLDLHRPWPCSSEPSGGEKEPAPWVPTPTTPIPKVWEAPYNFYFILAICLFIYFYFSRQGHSRVVGWS